MKDFVNGELPFGEPIKPTSPNAESHKDNLLEQGSSSYSEILSPSADQINVAPFVGDHSTSRGDNDDLAAHNYTDGFGSAPKAAGEILVSLGKITQWDHHPRRHSRFCQEHAAKLFCTAQSDPLRFRPVEVISRPDGCFAVKDGRTILDAIKAAHPDKPDLKIRAIVFRGTEKEAVKSVCDAIVGSASATKMEIARCLLNVQTVAGVSQVAIAERYAGLDKDKISRMLIAARVQQDKPELFEVLAAPHKAPISYGTALSSALKAMPEAQVTEILQLATATVESGARLSVAKALELFGISGTTVGAKSGKTASRIKAFVPLISEPIFGHDDKPIGARERLADNIDRLRLPDPAPMTHEQCEEAAEAFILEVRKHFGLV